MVRVRIRVWSFFPKVPIRFPIIPIRLCNNIMNELRNNFGQDATVGQKTLFTFTTQGDNGHMMYDI